MHLPTDLLLTLKMKYSILFYSQVGKTLISMASMVSILYLLCQLFTTYCVTKATAIQFIDCKHHIKTLKSCRTGLTNCIGSIYHAISCHWLLMPSGWTHMHTCIPSLQAVLKIIRESHGTVDIPMFT